jgi:hypothetical protein
MIENALNDLHQLAERLCVIIVTFPESLFFPVE